MRVGVRIRGGGEGGGKDSGVGQNGIEGGEGVRHSTITLLCI